MNFRRLMSMVEKEVRQLVRDRRLVALLITTPVIQLFFFGYAVTTDLKGVKLGVILQDPTPEARDMVQAIRHTPAFELEAWSPDPRDSDRWLESSRVDVAIRIPPGFAAALAKGESPVVQVLSDGTDSNTATLAFQYLSGAVTQWASQQRFEWLRLHPQQAIRLVGVPRINVESRFWYNPDLKSANFQVPGLLAIILLAIVMSQSSLAVVRERELGNLEQLSVTPMQPIELLLGKTIPVAIEGLLMTLMIIGASMLCFGLQLKGSLLFLLFCAILFLVNVMGLGLLISVVSRTQFQAQLTTNLLLSPLIMLSGFLFPIVNLPLWAQWMTYVMPTRYYIIVVRGVFLKGQGLAELWPQAIGLAVLGILSYLAGILASSKRVA